MSVCVVTGAGGLIGSEAVRYFAEQGMDVVGVDNDMRALFFGEDASTMWNCNQLKEDLGSSYSHYPTDIRDSGAMDELFKKYASDITLIIHAAAQPSHDWAARDPFMDFSVNANGTLNLLEATRKHCPEAVFIFTSTNKVYGDTPNFLPLVEKDERWEIDESHPYFKNGIDITMSIDQCKHSLFGASKVSADVLVQEYGRYFDMKTVCFRGGCLTGPSHSGTELHGFLSYLMKCAINGKKYTIFGYKGKQVRDNIHSHDLITCFHEFFKAPRSAAVYNMGGGRFSNCSMMEAIKMAESLSGREFNYEYSEKNRSGDHIWWISDTTQFANDYPGWSQSYGITDILKEIYVDGSERWKS